MSLTVDDLVAACLSRIRKAFYEDRTREYKRDERALLKAIARYGYECEQRGWDLDCEYILKDITNILARLALNSTEVRYLPAYLDTAVKGTVRRRAEEIQARSRQVAPKVGRVVERVSTKEAVIVRSNVETLAQVFKALTPKKTKKTEEQLGLL